MILSQLESLINDNLKLINQHKIKVPYELAMSLMKCDPGKLFIYTKKFHNAFLGMGLTHGRRVVN